jgi:hypothetical protein
MTNNQNQTQTPSILHVDAIDGARRDVICVPSSVDGAGALLWWALSGSIQYSRLREAWLAAGLPASDCPAAPSPALALRLAVHANAHGTLLARRFDGGWVIAQESASDADGHRQWQAAPVVKVRLSDSLGSDVTIEGNAELGAVVRAHYHAALVDWPATSVSGWLPTYVQARCDGIAMRESGGIYYVPPAAVPALQRVREVLESVSGHRLTLIQALRTEEAVEAILGSLATDTASAIEAALEGADTPRKAKNRRDLVAALRARLERYEDLLGAKHLELADQLDQADRALALIALADSAPADAA